MFIFLYHAGKTSAYSFIRSFCAELYKSGFLSSNLKTSVAAADLDPGSGAFWNPGSELGVFRIPDPTITNDSVGKIFFGVKTSVADSKLLFRIRILPGGSFRIRFRILH